jgi:hypothetical protein
MGVRLALFVVELFVALTDSAAIAVPFTSLIGTASPVCITRSAEISLVFLSICPPRADPDPLRAQLRSGRA